MAGDLELLQILQTRIVATNCSIDELASGDEAVHWFANVPGIGAFF